MRAPFLERRGNIVFLQLIGPIILVFACNSFAVSLYDTCTWNAKVMGMEGRIVCALILHLVIFYYLGIFTPTPPTVSFSLSEVTVGRYSMWFVFFSPEVSVRIKRMCASFRLILACFSLTCSSLAGVVATCIELTALLTSQGLQSCWVRGVLYCVWED